MAAVVAGIALGQFALYAPSFLGQRVLLPVDLLAQQGWYLPASEAREIVPQRLVLGDLVLAFELQRRFAAEEIRAGRLPLWNPYSYTGSPMVRWAPLAPLTLPYYLLPAPWSLVWLQLLVALTAGVGAGWFFRRALGLGPVAATVGGICYPLSGFFILWQGFPLAGTVAWLPWLLLATDSTVARPKGLGGPALAVVTALTMTSGMADVGGQMLLAAGLYGVGRAVDLYGPRLWRPQALRSLAAAAAGGLLGLLLSAHYLLPLGEYLSTGSRIAQRAAGSEERPPVGLEALPQIVFPDIYGSWERGSFRIVPGNQLSSSATTYVGLLATLVLAPLAAASRRHRGRNLLWVVLAVVGAGWTLDLPGLVHLLRLPGLNLMSHNRLVFLTAFALLALAVTGLDRLRHDRGGWRPWAWIPVALLLAAAIANIAWIEHPPEPLASQLQERLEAGQPVLRVPTLAALEHVRETFRATYARNAVLAFVGGCCWLALRVRRWPRPALGIAFGALLVAELLLFARGRNPQTDPKLYYPSIPALEELAQAPPGRVLGIRCLPPNLNLRFRLREVRGYDAVDPARLVELVERAADPSSPIFGYSRLMWLLPGRIDGGPDDARLPPIFDLLGVRYLIFRGPPPDAATPRIVGDDYWVAENRRALPRVFVPRRTEVVADPEIRLRRLADPSFDPRAVAFLEDEPPVGVPEARGDATLVEETPTRLVVRVDMLTPGLVVLTDLWHPGWRATVGGEPADVRRVDHALRGVAVPAGQSTVTFSYRPASLQLGAAMAVGALIAVAAWTLGARRIGGP